MRATKRLNKYLKIFNQETGEYLNLIGNESKNIPALSGFVKINDFDNASISNVIEYTIRLANFLIDQLDVSKAVDTLLDFQLETYYNKLRKKNETDGEYYLRSSDEIFDDKVSNLAIKKKLEDFGTDVEVIDGIGGDSAYYGVSYYNNENDFSLAGQNVVKKSIYSVEGGRPYFFRVLMGSVLPSEYKTIINVINEYKAGGTNYIVELKEIFSQTVGFYDTSFYNYEDSDLTASPVVTAGFSGA
jgi:hypothetical protein